MSYRLIAVAVAAILLEGCANKPPPPPVAGEDLNVGISKTCTPSQVQPTAGATVNATLNMSNDGWCAVRVKEADSEPFLLGLLRQRPEHGTMLVQKLGGETRLEYTPSAGYTGADAFSVALRPHEGGADAMVQVAVTVTPGAGVPVAAPVTQPERKPTPGKRTTTRRPAHSTKKPTTTH